MGQLHPKEVKCTKYPKAVHLSCSQFFFFLRGLGRGKETNSICFRVVITEVPDFKLTSKNFKVSPYELPQQRVFFTENLGEKYGIIL